MSATASERALAVLSDAGRYRSLVPFVGAGVSKGCGLPDWAQLVAPMRDAVGAKTDVDGLDVAQWFSDQESREELERYVRHKLSVPSVPSASHRQLANVAAPVICTTNYDTLIEKAIEDAEGVPPEVIIEDAHIGLIDEARRTTVVKLHGCLTLPDTIVLTRDDYEAYAERHRAMTAYLQALLATRTFLFAGFSLTDINFRTIYSAIGRALGPHQKTAYVLAYGEKWPDPVVRYWEKKGIETITLDDQAEFETFLRRLADGSRGSASVLEVAAALAPELTVLPISIGLEAAHSGVKRLIEQARSTGLLPLAEEPIAETPGVADPSGDRTDLRQQIQDQARAILEIAAAIDAAVPLESPTDWATIGELLYEQGDATGAIQAYQTALRPTRPRRELDRTMLRRVRGNLARAYARQGHFDRSEWLLRRCVFKHDQELPEDDTFTRKSVFDRMNLEGLHQRPTDASELVYAMTRRAERLIGDGRHKRAFDLLKEARYMIEPLLGKSLDPTISHIDLFAKEPVGRRRRWHGRDLGDHPYVPKAWAPNFFGKAYRLTALAASKLGRSGVWGYARRADRYLHDASRLDPLLRHPYDHRILLRSDVQLTKTQRTQLKHQLDSDILELKATTAGQRLVSELRAAHPTAALD